MTASDIRDWISNGGETPDWIADRSERERELLRKYWRTTIANQTRNTHKNRATPLKQFANWHNGSLLEVRPIDIEDWRDHLVTDGYGYRSVRQKIYALSPFFKTLVKRGVIDENPVDRVEIEHFEKTK